MGLKNIALLFDVFEMVNARELYKKEAIDE